MAAPIRTSKLGRLHTDLADVMSEMLKGEPLVDPNGRAVLDESGKPIYLRPKAAILKEVREFLKDNGIDSEPIDITPTGRATKGLKHFDDEPLQLEQSEDTKLIDPEGSQGPS